MDYLEIARARQSCRAYDATRPVEEEKLLTCLEAARLAPSACNAQPYHITVARGATAKAVGAATRSMGMNGFTREAPVFLVISEAAYNQTAAVAYLTAEAQSQGLSSCILGWFDGKRLRQLLDLKGPVRLVIALGYAKASDSLRPKKRKAMDQLVTWR